LLADENNENKKSKNSGDTDHESRHTESLGVPQTFCVTVGSSQHPHTSVFQLVIHNDKQNSHHAVVAMNSTFFMHYKKSLLAFVVSA